ncbi:unnamed protein product [Penicillium pancosmium]
MARSAQTARRNAERPRWHQRQYLDHEGNSVVLGRLCTVQGFNKPEGYYQHRIQIYTKVPIDPANFVTLYQYLFDVRWDPAPFLEIYTATQPNAVACVDHQRLEIIHRKNLHRASDEQRDSQPPLIAKDKSKGHLQILDPSGSCIFLTSDSYLVGDSRREGNERGTAPLSVDFSRRIPTEVREVDLKYRIPGVTEDVVEFVRFVRDSEVVSEVIDMTVNPPRDQYFVNQWVHRMWQSVEYNLTPDGEFEIDYDVDVSPPETTTWNSQDIRDILEQQSPSNYQTEDLYLKWGVGRDDQTLTVTNFTDSEKSDLQYIIHVPFLAHIADNLSLLERTARIFTTQMVSQIGSTRMRFEFRIPGSGLGSVLSSPNPNNLPVGALYIPKDGSKAERHLPLQRGNVVILERPAFITEPGILFLIEDLKWKQEFDCCYGTTIRRSICISEAARRLAMQNLKDGVGWDDLRYLKADEYRRIFGFSLAQYQEAVFGMEPFEPHQPREEQTNIS